MCNYAFLYKKIKHTFMTPSLEDSKVAKATSVEDSKETYKKCN